MIVLTVPQNPPFRSGNVPHENITFSEQLGMHNLFTSLCLLYRQTRLQKEVYEKFKEDRKVPLPEAIVYSLAMLRCALSSSYHTEM